jgi:hypothetical protein
MTKLLKIFILLFLATSCVFAQVTPKEGSKLNYRIIGFSFPEKSTTASYKVQVASGNYDNDNAFQKNIVVTVAAKENKIIAEVPSFGKQYTWRVVYLDDHSKATKSELYHFSTMMSPNVNPDSVHMRVVSNTGKYRDYYVFVDGNKVLYDMKGNPVWFFPKIDSLDLGSIHLRDLKRSSFGTITVIVDERIYEINYNGDILWKGPGNDKAKTDSINFQNSYHHEFMRLPNGHYMTMGFEQDIWRLPGKVDSNTFTLLKGKIIRDSNNVYYQKMYFGTLLEYDEQGNISWKWSGADYFKGSDLNKRMIQNEIFDLNDTHANAFYFDEKTQSIYISFRDINRIIKIQYPSGKVLGVYGKLYTPGMDRRMKNGLFCGQHSCRLSQEGYLYLFNNNICHSRALPTILMLKEPKSGKDTLEKIWEFECPMEELASNATTGGFFNFGGNVFELPDSALFVCMGGLYGKLFIVNRDKNILWSARPEKWDKDAGKWTTEGVFIDARMREGSYRASIINRDELESMIWNEPLKK